MTEVHPRASRPTPVRGAAAALVALIVVTAASAACSSTTSSSAPATTARPRATTSVFEGHLVSSQARMVCSNDARVEMVQALGLKTTAPPEPGWNDRAYTCTYTYAGGVHFVLSVYDLATTAAARTDLDQLGHTLGRTDQAVSFGTAPAFMTPTGNVVVQKDEHVLVVDVSGVPATWLSPPQSRADVAQIVAGVIMGCWTGG